MRRRQHGQRQLRGSGRRGAPHLATAAAVATLQVGVCRGRQALLGPTERPAVLAQPKWPQLAAPPSRGCVQCVKARLTLPTP